MKHNYSIRRTSRKQNAEKRKQILKLYSFWCSVFFLLLSSILLVISWFCHDCDPWWSGVLVSASCGGFTGFAFYALANVRSNQERKITNEYNSLKHTYNILKDINPLRMSTYYKTEQNTQVISDIKNKILDYLDELENSRNKIDYSVYDIYSKGYDPIDRDNMNSYRDKIRSANTIDSLRKCIEEIYDELKPVSDILSSKLKEREEQISFIGSLFL